MKRQISRIAGAALIVTLSGCAAKAPLTAETTAASKPVAIVTADFPNGLIAPNRAKEFIDAGISLVLLDVRTSTEFDEGHIAGAVLLPYTLIDADSAKAHIPDLTTPILVYCRSGRRSAIAATALRDLGYATVLDLGGIQDWPYGVVR
jgi:rhodanese-related sulfurtransferase